MTGPTSLALAERMAPLHMSYPTAPHSEGHRRHTDARLACRIGAPRLFLSLYFDVPICKEICAYCGCHTKALQQDAPLTATKRPCCAKWS
jgi:oxygen-independent coproporphyrinogen-3 oxidase